MVRLQWRAREEENDRKLIQVSICRKQHKHVASPTTVVVVGGVEWASTGAGPAVEAALFLPQRT